MFVKGKEYVISYDSTETPGETMRFVGEFLGNAAYLAHKESFLAPAKMVFRSISIHNGHPYSKWDNEGLYPIFIIDSNKITDSYGVELGDPINDLPEGYKRK